MLFCFLNLIELESRLPKEKVNDIFKIFGGFGAERLTFIDFWALVETAVASPTDMKAGSNVCFIPSLHA